MLGGAAAIFKELFQPKLISFVLIWIFLVIQNIIFLIIYRPPR